MELMLYKTAAKPAGLVFQRCLADGKISSPLWYMKMATRDWQRLIGASRRVFQLLSKITKEVAGGETEKQLSNPILRNAKSRLEGVLRSRLHGACAGAVQRFLEPLIHDPPGNQKIKWKIRDKLKIQCITRSDSWVFSFFRSTSLFVFLSTFILHHIHVPFWVLK